MSPRWAPDPDVRRGRSVVYNLHAHLVFTPKYRRKVFSKAMLDRMAGPRSWRWFVRTSAPTSRMLRKDFGPQIRRHLWGGHLWSSYFVGSVGGAPLQVVKDYITNQRVPT